MDFSRHLKNTHIPILVLIHRHLPTIAAAAAAAENFA